MEEWQWFGREKSIKVGLEPRKTLVGMSQLEEKEVKFDKMKLLSLLSFFGQGK